MRGAELSRSWDLLEADVVYRSAVIAWDDVEILTRVEDDLVEEANNCSDSYCEVAALQELSLATVETEIKKMMSGMRLYGLADQLLSALLALKGNKQ
jgi:hypothetical protein